MKKFCKILVTALMVLSVSILMGCSDDSNDDSVVELLPNNGLAFGLFPNDEAPNDSASANLSHGIFLYVHPKASYELSFDADPSLGTPTLQLFRIYESGMFGGYKANFIRDVEAKKVDGRYVYTFSCDEKKKSIWAVTLKMDDHFYKGSTNNVKFTGVGAYSDHMNLNLVVVGNVERDLDGYSLQEFADSLLANYRKFYSSVTIDTLYISYADKHPTLGSKYPSNAPWISGDYSGDIMMSELGGWPGIESALDIIFFHYIDEVGVMGYSGLYSGNMGEGDGSTVILGAYVKTYNGEYQMSMREIIETALHESGHFFGLRHTTSSVADMSALGDFSNVEDGLDDTPYCQALQKSGLLKGIPVKTDIWTNRRTKFFGAGVATFDPETCPDATNYMFPLGTDLEFEGFSKNQLDLIRNNLMIFPH